MNLSTQYGLPSRLAGAVHAMLERDGDAKHERKLHVLANVLRDFARIPLTAGQGAIYHAAEKCAKECRDFFSGINTATQPEFIRMRIDAICTRMGVRYPCAKDDAQAWARVMDVQWWVRALRKEFSRRFENTVIQLGQVGKGIDPYISRESAYRQAERNDENAKRLAECEIICEETGQVITLAQAAAGGMGNKANRRNELMTRIRGFEEIATAMKHRALFATITAPSKFHSVGGRNERYADYTPREAQAYLCGVWARIRAALKRAGIVVYGFRVAEPHEDACPHWHLLLFVSRKNLAAMKRIIKAYSLAEDGNEPGAKKQRVKLVTMESGKGTAAGYIAKYIAKNIDGMTADGQSIGVHQAYGETKEGGYDFKKREAVLSQVYEGRTLTPAERVCYWSQLHGIRQFQQIGGAPVGVWRELRRIEEKELAAAPLVVRDAWHAVQKKATGQKDENGKEIFIQADWKAYVMAQGGPGCGRDAAIQLWKKEVTIEGRYGRVEAEKPCGVYAVAADDIFFTPSVRYEWKPAQAGVGLDLPWTGVNNCTEKPGKNAAWVNAKNKNFGSATLQAHEIERIKQGRDYAATEVRPQGDTPGDKQGGRQARDFEKFKTYRAAQWGGVSVHLLELRRKYEGKECTRQ